MPEIKLTHKIFQDLGFAFFNNYGNIYEYTKDGLRFFCESNRLEKGYFLKGNPKFRIHYLHELEIIFVALVKKNINA